MVDLKVKSQCFTILKTIHIINVMLGKIETESPTELDYATNYSNCVTSALIRANFEMYQKTLIGDCLGES